MVLIRRIVTLLVLLLVAAPALIAAQRDMDKALEAMNGKDQAAAFKAADLVLANAQRAPAAALFVASAVNITRRDAAAAAYLFYAAQMRSRYDLNRYPPPKDAKGGDNPGIPLMALNQQIGAAVNPMIMRQPKVLSEVLKRLETFKPATPPNYDPGWKYGPPVANDEAMKLFSEYQREFLSHFRGLATLLNDPDYFAAFKTVQDFNLGTETEARIPAKVKAKQEAEKKMAAIEKQRGIEGFYFHKP